MNTNIYPFFLECEKKTNSVFLKKVFRALTFGKGGFIFVKKNKNVLITVNGEFVIPVTYSEEERLKLEKLLNVETFESEIKQMKESRASWSRIRKKDKLNLIYKHISLMDTSLQEKRKLASFVVLALFLKLINNEDIEYDGEKIVQLSDKITKAELYDLLVIENNN